MKTWWQGLLFLAVLMATPALAASLQCSDSTGNLRYASWYDAHSTESVIGREAWTLKSQVLYSATYFAHSDPIVQGKLSATFVEGTAQYAGDNEVTQIVTFKMNDGSLLPYGVKAKMVLLCRTGEL